MTKSKVKMLNRIGLNLLYNMFEVTDYNTITFRKSLQYIMFLNEMYIPTEQRDYALMQYLTLIDKKRSQYLIKR